MMLAITVVASTEADQAGPVRKISLAQAMQFHLCFPRKLTHVSDMCEGAIGQK
jgi:hypothetical protein